MIRASNSIKYGTELMTRRMETSIPFDRLTWLVEVNGIVKVCEINTISIRTVAAFRMLSNAVVVSVTASFFIGSVDENYDYLFTSK